MGFWKNAFAIEPPLTEADLNPRQVAVLDRLVAIVHRHGMEVPAALFLESVKPLNFVGSQVLLFFQPLARPVILGEDYDELQRLLENRGTVEILIRRIEARGNKESEPKNEA